MTKVASYLGIPKSINGISIPKKRQFRKLSNTITGKGEVKGFLFTRVDETPTAYLYRVTNNGKPYYEVFKKIVVKSYDFDNRLRLETYQEAYPKANSFGKTAWTYFSFERAMEKLACI